MLSWLFPGICELCGEASEASLCPACLAKLPRVPRPICLYCGAPLRQAAEEPFSCPECKGKPRHFDFARPALEGNEMTLPLVRRLKYHRANHLAPALAPLLAELWEQTPALRAQADWALVPVPVPPARLFARGYNQAEELARALGRLRGLPVVNALCRRGRGQESQTHFSAQQRQQNAFAAYRAQSPFARGRQSLPPHVLLVDDVFTTGATARACARALRSLPGVETVGVLTLLRISLGGGEEKASV